jgi:nitrogen-specific signal transduction histidine kinase
MNDAASLLLDLARPVRHEANNLLAALAGTAELMQRAPGASARDIARAERLTEASERLQALLHAYLALGAPPADGTAARTVFESMRPLVRLSVGPGRLAEMVAAPGLPALAATPGALQAATLRLAREAAAMAPPGSMLRLALEPAPGGAVLAAAALPSGEGPPPVFLAGA